MNEFPAVSIIIPCRNEERFIAQCLDSVLAQSYSPEHLEVIVADGASTDGTIAILQEYASKYSMIRVVRNEKKITPIGLNLAIKAASGGIIIRMDCHARYAKDYVSLCVFHLLESGADNVGGMLKTVAAKNSLMAKSIALCLSHPLGTGGSSFRLSQQHPKEVDTVFGGCYRREVFDRIGLFNEQLKRSQDMEFNVRLKRAGGKIILFPDIVCEYYPKSTLWSFFIHDVNDGVWAIIPLKFTHTALRSRHYAPLGFFLLLAGLPLLGIWNPLFLSLWFALALTYIITLLFFSLEVARKEKNMGYLLALPLAFAARHIGYGLGSLIGVIQLLW